MSLVAFPQPFVHMNSMKRLVLAVFFQATAILAWADGPPAPSEPPPPGPPHHGKPDGFPHSGWHERSEAFKQLSESDRQKVRAAFDKIWNRPDVATAREKLNKANEEYRKTIQSALREADPEVAKILEKVSPWVPTGGPMLGRMPDPNDPEFAKKAVNRLSLEIQGAVTPDRFEGGAARMHELALENPQVKEALATLQQAQSASDRIGAYRHLREVYQSTVQQLLASKGVAKP